MLRKTLACLAMSCLLQQAPASASVVASTRIIFVENGWFGEGLAIKTQGSGVSGCPAASNEFAIAASHPSYQQLVAIALNAFSTDQAVELVVEDGTCLFGNRTKIVSIRLIK